MNEAPVRVRVWDWPTRIFHWSIVLLIPVLWWTAEEEEMDWHMLAGKTMLGLLLFRILWGFIGGSTARFSSFVKGPRAIISLRPASFIRFLVAAAAALAVTLRISGEI